MFRCLFLTLALIGCGPGIRGDKDALARYENYAFSLRKEVTRTGPVAGADLLRKFVANDPPIADLCHGLSHEIGEEAYATVGLERALELEDDVCGSGYVHGVIESYLAQVPDLDAALSALCAPDAAKCFHGIGHGLMDRSGNDLPESLQRCATFPKAHQRNHCAEGVFMENFDANGAEHTSDYLVPDDIYFPCRDRTPVFEGVCALYAPRYYLRLHPDDYAGLGEWCRTVVPAGPRDACMKGLGSVAMKQHIANPAIAERLCRDHAVGFEKYCFEGLASYYVVHHASVAKGRELCTVLSDDAKPACDRILTESAAFYRE